MQMRKEMDLGASNFNGNNSKLKQINIEIYDVLIDIILKAFIIFLTDIYSI